MTEPMLGNLASGMYNARQCLCQGSAPLQSYVGIIHNEICRIGCTIKSYEHLDSLWILLEIKSVSFNSLCASFAVTKVKLTVREASLIALLAPKFSMCV